MNTPPRCKKPKRHEESRRTRDGRDFCQTCELWKAMVSVVVWEGATPTPANAPRRRTMTVGALTIEELREMLPRAIANVCRAADIEPPDDYVEDDDVEVAVDGDTIEIWS